MDTNSNPPEAELFKIDQENYKKLAEKYPDKVVRTTQFDSIKALENIGIYGVHPPFSGYLRYYPQDFIVEEMKTEDDQTTVEWAPQKQIAAPSEENPTLFADVVKIGIGTFEVINQLAAKLEIPPTKIGYAGMKDGRALTSQRMSIRGVSPKQLTDLPRGHFFLKVHSVGRKTISPGQLLGNRFTITIRVKEAIEPSILESELRTLATKGFPNFFGTQRFGHRMINTYLGQLLSQGKAEEAIRAFLVGTGPFDIPLYSAMRKKSNASYGDWRKMKAILDILPYRFRHERMLLEALISGEQPERALFVIKDQVRFWFFSYGSFLVNQFLSEALIKGEEVSNPLPIPQTSNEADDLFRAYLRRDNTEDYQTHMQVYSFIRRRPRTMLAWIRPTIHGHQIINKKNIILDFALPKAAYATTFLMFLFRLHGGNPVPSWVDDEELDAKSLLGTGSVTTTLEHLEMPLQNRIPEVEPEN